MQKEKEEAIERAGEDFKNLVFANNVELYRLLFVEPPESEDDLEEDDLNIPQTIGDVANLLIDLKGLGLDLGDTELPD